MDARRNRPEHREMNQEGQYVQVVQADLGAVEHQIIRLIHEHFEQETAVQREIAEATKEGNAPAKKTRFRFKPRFQTVTESGKPIRTVRDLVSMIPADQGGVTVFYNHMRDRLYFKKKKNVPKRVETVAKPRDRSLGHTLVHCSKQDVLNTAEQLIGRMQPRQ
ncbi:unnamed protein product [Caenorhabditis sp. 36 PRJEB53466]|nr:unnamed protein product [Caenorhabditis sp. 36 PRJEB53466]